MRILELTGKLLSEKDEHATAIMHYQIALSLAPQSPILQPCKFFEGRGELRGDRKLSEGN